MWHMNVGYVLLSQGIAVQFLAKTGALSFSFCTMTNKSIIISQIITRLHVSPLSCRHVRDIIFIHKLMKSIFITDCIYNYRGYVVAQLVEALRYNSEGRVFDSFRPH